LPAIDGADYQSICAA
jgi:hypothetical protein